MSHRYLLSVSLFAVLMLSACPAKYPKCSKDEDCKVDGHNEVCVEGTCQECGRDADCKTGFVCQANKCVPKPECASDGECPAGYKCRDQKCVAECTADTDCPSGMQCRDGRCALPAECSSDADCPAGKKCDPNQRCTEGLSSGCQLVPVHFDFNEATLTSTARQALDQNADCLKSQKGKIVISGHCDERGTEEYNLHLGERRANSVKKYLNALGVDGKAMKTLSFGKERPVNPGHDEAAWSENRRAEFSDR